MSDQELVIGIDAGFTYTGWASYNFVEGLFKEVGVISSPRPNLTHISPGETDFQLDVKRCTKIARELCALIERIDPIGLCIETGRGFRQARATYTMGMANGAMFATISLTNIMHDTHRYIDMIHPSLTKKHFSGPTMGRKVTKAMVQKSALARWPYMIKPIKKFPGYKANHIVDAMCAVGASIDERGLVHMLSVGHSALEEAHVQMQEAEELAMAEMKNRHKSDSQEV